MVIDTWLTQISASAIFSLSFERQKKPCARQRSAFLISSSRWTAVADCARNSLQTCPVIQEFMTLGEFWKHLGSPRIGYPSYNGHSFPVEVVEVFANFGTKCDMLKRRVHVCRLSGRNAVMKAVQMLHGVRTNLKESKKMTVNNWDIIKNGEI